MVGETVEPDVRTGGFAPEDANDVPMPVIRAFLDFEAELLDDTRRMREWCDLLTEDFVYEVPVRVRHDSQSTGERFPAGSLHIYEDKVSVDRRVRRLETGHAWGEDPPSLLRRVIGGVRARRAADGELHVRSAFLLYHNRTTIDGEIVAGERQDVVRVADGRFFLARRTVYLDHVVIPTQNITFFF
jgi:3-phenylpropionate/cinnamic acid dioxygenase small subunit